MQRNKFTYFDKKAAKKLLINKYKYIARDKDGQLFLYYYKPQKLSDKWWSDAGRAFYTKPKKFKHIKWGNDAPTFIADIINGEMDRLEFDIGGRDEET